MSEFPSKDDPSVVSANPLAGVPPPVQWAPQQQHYPPIPMGQPGWAPPPSGYPQQPMHQQSMQPMMQQQQQPMMQQQPMPQQQQYYGQPPAYGQAPYGLPQQQVAYMPNQNGSGMAMPAYYMTPQLSSSVGVLEPPTTGVQIASKSTFIYEVIVSVFSWLALIFTIATLVAPWYTINPIYLNGQSCPECTFYLSSVADPTLLAVIVFFGIACIFHILAGTSSGILAARMRRASAKGEFVSGCAPLFASSHTATAFSGTAFACHLLGAIIAWGRFSVIVLSQFLYSPNPVLIQNAGPALNGVALGFAFVAMVIAAVSKCRLRATAVSHPSAGATIEVMLGAPIQACCCC